MKVKPESFKSYSQAVTGTKVTVSPSGLTWAEVASKKIPGHANGQSTSKSDIHKYSVYQVCNQKTPGLVSTSSADTVSQRDKSKDERKLKELTNVSAITFKATVSYANTLKEKSGGLKIKEPIAESRGDIYINTENRTMVNRSKDESSVLSYASVLRGVIHGGGQKIRKQKTVTLEKVTLDGVSKLWEKYRKINVYDVERRNNNRLSIVKGKLDLMQNIEKIWRRHKLVDMGKLSLCVSYSSPLRKMEYLYEICFNTILYDLKGYLEEIKINSGVADVDRNKLVLLYNHSWMLRDRVLGEKYEYSPSSIIKSNELDKLENFLKHILLSYVLPIVKNQYARDFYQLFDNSLFLLRHYVPLINAFRAGSDKFIQALTDNICMVIGAMWRDFYIQLSSQSYQNAFHCFDKYICENSDIITQQRVPRTFEICKNKIKDAIAKVILKKTPSDKKNDIAGLCEKFRNKGWVNKSQLIRVRQWAAQEPARIVEGTISIAEKAKTEMPTDFRQNELQIESFDGAAHSSTNSNKETTVFPIKKEQSEDGSIIRAEIIYVSLEDIEDIVGKIEFNSFSNKAIRPAIPTAARLKSLLYGDQEIYNNLLSYLENKKPNAKGRLNQQQLALEWLRILASDNLRDNLANVYGRRQCALIFVSCIRRLLDEYYDRRREDIKDSSQSRCDDFLLNNIDLIKYAKCGLLTIIKSNLQKKISIKLLEDLSKMIESTGSENIIMGGDTEDELNQSFNVVSLGDSNVGNKQNIEMNRESESYCTTAFGKITHSGNERVSKPEAISTISPGKISWAKIVGFPVIPWKKADVKYDAETDKAGHGIHNLESEPFTKAEESCVINSGILSLSPEDIVGKLEFNACYNMAIQYAVPTADRVKSLLYGNETIYFMLLAGLRYTKARTKDKHDQQQLAREWLHILLSDNLIGNLGGLVGRKKCESIFVHCTRRLLDEAYDLIRADSSKKKYHDFLSNNAALIKATLRDLMYIAKSGFEQNKTYDYLINGINTLLGDMASKAIHMGGQSAGEERQSLAVVLLDDGNGKDKSDKEWISENERSCTTAPGKHHSGNEPASKSEEVSTILPDIKTWAQMVKPPVIPKKNKVDVKYDADHVIHNLKIEPLTEAQERVIHHAIRGKPMALSVPVMSENSPGPKNWSQMVKLPVIPEKNKEGVKYDANHGICNLKIEPLTEAQEKVIHHAIPDKPMVLPVTIALENQNHTVDQNKRLSVQPDCLKKDLLDQDIEATDELMGSAIKRENTSPDNQGKYRLKKKTDPVKKYLKSVEGSSIRSPSALNVIRNGSYCDAVYKSFQNRYKETFDKAVIFLPQLVTELLKDKPIDKKSSIVNLVYKLIFLYVEKATDRIVSFDSGGHPEHKEDVFLDLDPIRNVHSYLLGKGMLVSEEDKQGFESIVKDIQEIECRCRSFVIDRLNKLYSEKSPDLQEICRTVRAGLFLDVINKDYARRMLDNSDYLNQIDQTLDLLQALTLQRLFQQNLSTDDAHNVTDILEFATKFDDRLSGPALSKNENSGHENLPSDIDETLCFKVFRGHLITCLRSYTSRANNDVVSSEKQKTRLDSKGEEIKRIADSPEMKKISEKITDSVSLYRKPRSRSVIIEYSQILKDLEGLKRLCSDCKSSYWADQFYTSLYCSYVLNLVDHTVFVRRSRHSLSNCVCYHKLLKLCIEQFNKMDMNGFFSEEQCSRMDKLLIRVFSATAFALKIYNKSCVESSNLDELILYNSYQVNNLERLGTNLFENIHEIEKSQFSNQALSDKSSECVKLYNACSEGIRKDIALRTTRCTEHSPHEEHRSLLDITTVVSRTKSGVI